ncbi:hypothetical protein BDV29DRAFT_197414 [Aspergillus leporis]|uniref:NADH:flavin oxidoreductase/NADH oxidase N-terminal domain-containing protein n=1 Tax=Aspergillus leporis TaxID=41062 RepID=A0A5N5WW63_9EURO|nr:hypothetical protein BDV29DRAFT_197414 [Aspergillus leporis]
MSNSRLFKPLKLGNIELKNRVAMAPLTRFRADDNHVILPIAAEYYGQRASVPGTLLVAEAIFISHQHGGYANAPGIWSQEQIDAWKKITYVVHEKNSFIYLQLWALGRTADKDFAEKNGITVMSSSSTPISDEQRAIPKEMTKDDIKQTIAAYAQAAKNAIAAGFDGVEIHGANGYLLDQFLQDNCNKRTDDYGGSVENRSRFAVEVAKAVVGAVGAKRTGIRFSPWSPFEDMKMKDPIPQFSDIIKKMNALDLSYIHLIESRVAGGRDVEADKLESLDSFLSLFDGPILVAGGLKPDNAKRLTDKLHPDKDIVAVFGRYFISTPDLVFRLKKRIEFNAYDRSFFYTESQETGYTDYPFSEEFKTAQAIETL